MAEETPSHRHRDKRHGKPQEQRRIALNIAPALELASVATFVSATEARLARLLGRRDDKQQRDEQRVVEQEIQRR